MKFPGLVYGVSTVEEGNMAERWGEKVTVSSNRIKFLRKLNINLGDCVMASLELGTRIVRVGVKDKGKYVECDALVTKETGVCLWMVTADCFPVVIYDPEKKILALVHLGYQGTNGKLPELVVKKMEELGSGASDLNVWIGPGIRKETYKWDPNTVKQKTDPEWQPYLQAMGDFIHVDIPGYIKDQLVGSGIKTDKIEDCGIDTGTDKRYFSHYRSKRTGETEGRFATIVMMR